MHLLAMVSASAALALQSPFPSDVPGLHIPNAHVVAPGPGQVLRGNAPLGDAGDFIPELKKLGVTDVLIFRDGSDGADTPELEKLKAVGIEGSRVRTVPFRWKNVESFGVACRQVVEALDFLMQVRGRADRKAFFHCTVGEDRTGLLAGLFRMLDQKWPLERAFRKELCRYGYEAGDPGKPEFISLTVRRELTPIFIRIGKLIESGRLSRKRLDPKVCDQEATVDPTPFVCQPQKL